MKSNKDISDLIRENAYKLEQRPSKNAWDRLENRLNEKPAKPRFSIRRILSIAAAVVGLVGFGAMISFSFLQQEPSMATANYDVETIEEFKVEEMKMLTDEEKGFYEVVEFQHKYQDRLSKPIIEGPRKKMTLAKKKK